MKEKIDWIIKILVIIGVVVLIIYTLILNHKIKEIKLDVIDSQLALRDSIVAQIQIKNKARIDTFWIRQETIKYYEKQQKDYEEFLKDLGLDSLIVEYWRTRPRL